MIFQSFDAVDLWFQAQTKAKFTVLAKNGAFLAISSIRVILILNGAPLVSFAWAILAEVAAGALGLLFFFVKRKSIRVLLRGSREMMGRLLRESWPLALSSVAIFIYMRIDQIMLAQMINDRELGLYAAALRFSEIWYFIPAAIVTSVAPSLTKIRTTSKKEYMKRLQQVFDWLARIAYSLALLMTFVAPWLVVSLYGEEYRRAGTVLAIHIWTALFVFAGVGSGPWMVNENAMRYSLFQTIVGACLNIALNYYIFVPRYGAIGAAIATLISQFVAAFAINAVIPRLRPLFALQSRSFFNPVRDLWRIV